MALKPPIATAPSRAPTIQATSGPATSTGPMPGMAKAAAPNNIPQSPPQKAPSFPQYFMAVLLAMLGAGSFSSGAVTVLAITTSAVATPPVAVPVVNVPTVSTPAGTPAPRTQMRRVG